MKRREFITLLGGAAATWSLAAHAQQRTMPVIGFLHAGSPVGRERYMAAFRHGLKEAGYVENQNVAIEYGWGEDQFDRSSALAADLVRRQVSLIVASSTPAALAAKAATTTIPIVFLMGADPVELGLVATLNRPGGTLTGVTFLSVEVAPKRLELLHQIVPSATVLGALVNPTNSAFAETVSRDLQATARTLGVQLHVLHASAEQDFDRSFATLVQVRVGGVVIAPDALFTGRSQKLAALALHHRVPAIYQFREFADTGGLMSYGSSATEAYRLVGVYTGKILKGQRPADLPVQRSAEVELFINLKTAKTLGVTIPRELLARADEVIE